MKMRSCPSCEMAIVSHAVKCVHCDAIMPKQKTSAGKIILIVVGSILAISIIVNSFTDKTETPQEQSSITNKTNNTKEDKTEKEPTSTLPGNIDVIEISEQEYKDSAIVIDYNNLAREPDKYMGTILAVTVDIAQTMTGGLLSEAGYRAYESLFSDEWWIKYEIPKDAPRILDKDKVTFYGEFMGLKSITRALTNTKDYVPQLDAKYYEILSNTADSVFSYSDTIVFDYLEITFYDAIEWVTLNNRYSDNHGADVAKIPVSIKNNKNETHGLNMFYFSQYGPDGLKLNDVSAYFLENDVAFAGNMRSGAVQNSFMHILYIGDGDYYVEFKDFYNTVEVKLPIHK